MARMITRRNFLGATAIIGAAGTTILGGRIQARRERGSGRGSREDRACRHAIIASSHRVRLAERRRGPGSHLT
jgi:hypothetical protein